MRRVNFAMYFFDKQYYIVTSVSLSATLFSILFTSLLVVLSFISSVSSALSITADELSLGATSSSTSLFNDVLLSDTLSLLFKTDRFSVLLSVCCVILSLVLLSSKIV